MIFLTAVFIGIALVFAAMPLSSASASSDNAADVVLPAGLGAYCETIGFEEFLGDRHYYGVGTRVYKADGSSSLTCAMELVEGQPVLDVNKFTYNYAAGGSCDFVETPGGRLNATCRFP